MRPVLLRLALGALAIGGTVGLYVLGRGRRTQGNVYHLRSVCPRCKEDLQLSSGVNRCPRCDLRIAADLRA